MPTQNCRAIRSPDVRAMDIPGNVRVTPKKLPTFATLAQMPGVAGDMPPASKATGKALNAVTYKLTFYERRNTAALSNALRGITLRYLLMSLWNYYTSCDVSANRMTDEAK